MKNKGVRVIMVVLFLIIGVMAYYDLKHLSSTGEPIAEMAKSGGL